MRWHDLFVEPIKWFLLDIFHLQNGTITTDTCFYIIHIKCLC